MLALLKKHMVLVGGGAIVLALLYYFFTSSSSTATVTADSGPSPVSQEILATLGNLRTIKLDNSVFSDPLFLSLSDFGVTIPPAAAGRRNPFAPVGANNAPAQKATTTSTTPPPSAPTTVTQ